MDDEQLDLFSGGGLPPERLAPTEKVDADVSPERLGDDELLAAIMTSGEFGANLMPTPLETREHVLSPDARHFALALECYALYNV